MLISAFILVVSSAALMQFAIFTWRASVLRTASTGLVNEAEATFEPCPNLLSSSSFPEVVAIYRDLCPELKTGSAPNPNLRAVSVYYALMGLLSRVGGLFLPAEGFSWTHRDMALCTQYATVRLTQRLERNSSVMSQARSY
jgi:hypothetical protein